jgi:hypothetical protein
LNFLIVAFAVFLLVKAINTLRRKPEQAPAVPPAPTKDQELLMEIRVTRSRRVGRNGSRVSKTKDVKRKEDAVFLTFYVFRFYLRAPTLKDWHRIIFFGRAIANALPTHPVPKIISAKIPPRTSAAVSDAGNCFGSTSRAGSS